MSDYRALANNLRDAQAVADDLVRGTHPWTRALDARDSLMARNFSLILIALDRAAADEDGYPSRPPDHIRRDDRGQALYYGWNRREPTVTNDAEPTA